MKLVLQIAAGVALGLLVVEAVRRYEAQQQFEASMAFLGKISADLPRLMTPPAVKLSQAPSAYIPQPPSQGSVDSSVQLARAAKWRADNQASMDRWKVQQRDDALRLKPDEICLGAVSGKLGTIVVRRVDNGVPVATQLLENYRPVECVGDYRVDKSASQFPQR
jgi:hypothetical protein